MVKIPTYKDIGLMYILSSAFVLISSMAFLLYITSGNFSKDALTNSVPILFGTGLFFVIGLASFISNTLNLIKLNKLNSLIYNNASKMDILVYENKFRWFLELRNNLITVSAVFILLVVFTCFFVYIVSTKGNWFVKVMSGLGAGFIGFVFVALSIYAFNFMKGGISGKLDTHTIIKGKIKGVYYATYGEDGLKTSDNYKMLIEYYVDGNTQEYLSDESYSERQLITLYQMKYIPMVSDGHRVRVYANYFKKVPIDDKMDVTIKPLGTLRDYVMKDKLK